MRYIGQGHEIAVPLPARPFAVGDAAALQAAFDREYETFYGRVIPEAEVEVLSWALTLRTAAPPPARVPGIDETRPAVAAETRPLYDPARDAFAPVPFHRRADLAPGDTVAGPAVIAEDATSTLVAAGFRGVVLANGYILLERTGTGEGRT